MSHKVQLIKLGETETETYTEEITNDAGEKETVERTREVRSETVLAEESAEGNAMQRFLQAAALRNRDGAEEYTVKQVEVDD